MKKTTYYLQSNSLVNAPGMFQWCMNTRSRDLNRKGKDEAAKLYFLVSTWPNAPAGLLMSLAKEQEGVSAVIDEGGEVVEISCKEQA